MGNAESKPHDSNDTTGAGGVSDYYSLLEVDESATADEIRVRFSQRLSVPYLISRVTSSARFADWLYYTTRIKTMTM